jgi:hypothetical protein
MFGIDDAIAAGLKILDKFVPDPAQKDQAANELRSALLAWDQAQTDVNAAEAQNPNLFVAGWRPAVGWVCASAFAYKFILMPFLVFLAVGCGVDIPLNKLPVLDWTELSGVLLGILGLGGLRTYEKIKGAS